MGDVAKTAAPLPVSSVKAAARFADDGVPKNVATPAPRDVIPVPPLAVGSVPVTPVVKGKPVADVKTKAVGVPSAGVTKVGEVANTNEPEPVSSVTAAAKLAELGVPRKVATPLPKDVIPVPPFPTGRVPVTLVARLVNVVEVVPVPPEAIGSAEPRVKEVKYEAASTTFVPLLKTSVALPAGTEMPVPEVFLTVLAPVPVLLIR